MQTREQLVADIAASFQEAAVEQVVSPGAQRDRTCAHFNGQLALIAHDPTAGIVGMAAVVD